MPPAMAYDKQTWPAHDTFISVVAFDCLCVPAQDLRRSIAFYSDLFAMRAVSGGADARRVVLSRDGRVRLALYAHRSAAAIPSTRITASVESLEAARDMVWNLGIETVRELGDDGSSFAIADPDGHEIRFIEQSRRRKRRPELAAEQVESGQATEQE